MKPDRTLSLRREHLSELDSTDLHEVVGASASPTCRGCPTLPIEPCVKWITDQFES